MSARPHALQQSDTGLNCWQISTPRRFGKTFRHACDKRVSLHYKTDRVVPLAVCLCSVPRWRCATAARSASSVRWPPTHRHARTPTPTRVRAGPARRASRKLLERIHEVNACCLRLAHASFRALLLFTIVSGLFSVHHPGRFHRLCSRIQRDGSQF